jgi:hypothetical protein
MVLQNQNHVLLKICSKQNQHLSHVKMDPDLHLKGQVGLESTSAINLCNVHSCQHKGNHTKGAVLFHKDFSLNSIAYFRLQLLQ